MRAAVRSAAQPSFSLCNTNFIGVPLTFALQVASNWSLCFPLFFFLACLWKASSRNKVSTFGFLLRMAKADLEKIILFIIMRIAAVLCRM